MAEILSITSLTKHYRKITALNGFSLKINRGEIYGLLGPNGSGKTTILSIITGVIFPDSGNYSWFGNGNGASNRKQIGALVEVPNFYPYLSLTNNLELVAKIKGVPASDVPRVLQLMNLFERKNAKFQELSLGMKQRLAIASALLGDPEVLIMDEPTNGLDPEGIAEVRQVLISEAEKGKTILLASHILDEVEKICTHVTVLKQGVSLATGKVSELLADEDMIVVDSHSREQLRKALNDAPMVKRIVSSNGEITLVLNSGSDSAQLNQHLASQQIFLKKLEIRKKTLESQFLELVK